MITSRLLRPAFHLSAQFAGLIAASMLIPVIAEIASGTSDWHGFAFASISTSALAVLIAVASSSEVLPLASPRFGILLINLLWMTLAVIGALPFMLSKVAMSPADALFESVSAITTTGSITGFVFTVFPRPGSGVEGLVDALSADLAAGFVCTA